VILLPSAHFAEYTPDGVKKLSVQINRDYLVQPSPSISPSWLAMSVFAVSSIPGDAPSNSVRKDPRRASRFYLY